MHVYDFNFQGLHGQTLPLTRFQGQPILLCNTASECGFTPQYAKLQKLYNDYRDSGLVVIGIPSNDFGEQEPGDEQDIIEFLDENYRISFPMTVKQHVIGPNMHPLFVALQEEFGEAVLPKWNFHKYLFGRRGELLEHWPSKVEPDDPVLTHQVERNLQSWVL